jgi:hypothetical protein
MEPPLAAVGPLLRGTPNLAVQAAAWELPLAAMELVAAVLAVPVTIPATTMQAVEQAV